MVSDAKYPIREVSRLTGVNPVTLRAWQRRYGLLQPARTNKGHRLYSEADIQLIRQILHWLEKGVSIGQVKGLLNESHPVAIGSNWEQAQAQLMECAVQLNVSRLETQLLELTNLYPAELVLRNVIEPWLQALTQLNRPDAQLIEQASQTLLKRLFYQLLTIKTGAKVAVARIGQVREQASVLAQFELQGMECRSIDLGVLEPSTLPLAKDRLNYDAVVIILGAGLSQSHFQEMAAALPEQSYFTGKLGSIYHRQGWLTQPFSVYVSDLVRDNHASFSLV